MLGFCVFEYDRTNRNLRQGKRPSFGDGRVTTDHHGEAGADYSASDQGVEITGNESAQQKGKPICCTALIPKFEQAYAKQCALYPFR